MKTPKRLEPIIGIAIRQQEEKERQLAQALHLKQQAENQLSRLKDYRREYHQDLSSSARINISQLINKQRFISQLDTAIAVQNEKTSHIRSLTDQRQRDWHHAKNRRDALESLFEKKLAALQKQAERHEQIEQDDRCHSAGNT